MIALPFAAYYAPRAIAALPDATPPPLFLQLFSLPLMPLRHYFDIGAAFRF